MNNEFRIKNMIADDILYQVEQQTKEDLKIYYANISQENKELKEKIDKAIEYGKSCIIEDLDVDKLDEEYKDIFKIAYEIHKHYLEILGDKEKEGE